MPILKILKYQRYFMTKEFLSGDKIINIAYKYDITIERTRQIIKEELGKINYKKEMLKRSQERKKILEEKRRLRYKTDEKYRMNIINTSKKRYERIHPKGNTKK